MRNLFNQTWVNIWNTYYEGEGGDPPSPPAPGGGGNPPKTTFTQADVDRFVANTRREETAKREKLAGELEQLRSNNKLTQEERDSLTAQIDALRNESLTKEQKLTRDHESLSKKYKTDTETLSGERDSWKNNYASLLINNELTTAAVSNNAFSPDQIISQLSRDAKVVPVLDEEGKETGKFQVLVKFQDVDVKTKKPVTLELSPADVVKRMVELPERFGNLFKSGVQPGLGTQKAGSKPEGTPDIKKMTPEEYREWRKTQRGK